MSIDIPTFFFKYKPINSLQDLTRLNDIIENNHIYMPHVTKLNDPFEGSTMKGPAGYAGISIIEAIDKDDSFIKELKSKYCVLALSSIFNSPQMWAYYCNDYSGICLCFKNNGSFDEAKCVQYVKSLSEDYVPYTVREDKELIDEICKQLYCKHSGWHEEYEWRIVREVIDERIEEFLSFSNDELAGIIIGHKMKPEVAGLIKKMIPESVQLFRTYPGEKSRVLHILPYDYVVIGDGFKPPFISDVKAFENYMNKS